MHGVRSYGVMPSWPTQQKMIKGPQGDPVVDEQQSIKAQQPAMGDSAITKASPPCVLVVEDEILVRMFAVDVLEEAGFDPIQAGTGAEALNVVAQRKEELRAAIIDLGLPDRRGDEIAAEIRSQCPELPIVIASGRSEKELTDRFSADRAVAILPKPYTEPLMLEVFARLGIGKD